MNGPALRGRFLLRPAPLFPGPRDAVRQRQQIPWISNSAYFSCLARPRCSFISSSNAVSGTVLVNCFGRPPGPADARPCCFAKHYRLDGGVEIHHGHQFEAMNAFLEAEQIELHRIVHGEQRFSYDRPLAVGDRLRATLTVTGLRQLGGADVISTSSGNSYVVDAKMKKFIMPDKFEPGFAMDVQYKDLTLAQEAARGVKMPIPMSATCTAVYEQARAAGYGMEDMSAVIKLWEKLMGVEIRGELE